MRFLNTNLRSSEQVAKKRSKRAGSAIMPILTVMFMLSVMGMALMSLTVSSLKITRRIQNSTFAFNIAESGGERALRWLKDQGAPPAGTATITPFSGAQTLSPGTYTVTIQPDAGNPSAILKAYTITSNGTASGLTEHVVMYVRQQSFGHYAYFTDAEVSAISGGRIWFYSGDRINGPAHSNNTGGSNFQVDWTTSNSAIFQGLVTSVASSINYNPGSPSTEAQFSKIFLSGSRGYQLNVDPIPLPSSSSAQQVAAWGSSTGFPGSNGVYLNANAGIYIAGDSAIVAKLDASGNQQFVITQGAKVTTVTYDLSANQTKYQLVNNGVPGPTTSLIGVGTQVIYSTGNVTSLSGTIANNLYNSSTQTITSRSAYTLATDVNNGKNITITNNLKYATAPSVSLPYNDPSNLAVGTLGLMASKVTIAAGTPTSMEVDAIILAGSSTASGSFSVADYNSKNPTGTLKVVGGIIQKNRGAVGTLSNGVLATGYAKNYLYDSRLADSPPPYFPTTGLYDRLSWQRLAPT